MSERELASLRAAWAGRTPTSPGPDCPAAEAIWEAVGGSRAKVEVWTMLAHNLGCPDCSALWRLARELRSSEGLDAAAAAPAGVAPLRRAGPARWLMGAGALAAAAVAALVLLPRTVHRESSPLVRGAGDGALRSDPTSAALDRTHAVLRWTGAPEGSRYTVVVSTRDLTVLYRKSGLASPEAAIPAESLAGVPAGGEIVWHVEAIAPGGQRISSGAFLSRVQ